MSGEPHAEEVERGNGDLTAICRARAREGLWLLYRELQLGERDAARDVIEAVETNPSRLMAFLDALESSQPPPSNRARRSSAGG